MTTEREALIARLRSSDAIQAKVRALNKDTRPGSLFRDAADMLEADACESKTHESDAQDSLCITDGTQDAQQPTTLMLLLSRAMVRIKELEAQQVAVQPGWVKGQYGYQTLFNAIATATTKEANGIGVSVVKFEDYMLAAAPQPPQREPMSDKSLEVMSQKYVSVRGAEDNHHFAYVDFARAIEAHHGIVSKP